MDQFKLKGEFIELYKLLKVMNYVSTGGEGKIMIADEQVKVNDELETRKRYKTRIGDVVEYQNNKVELIASD